MTLATLRTSFSRPESEVICSYLVSKGIPAIPGERHHATSNGDYLIAHQGIRIQLPEAFLDKARQLLRERAQAADLSESRAFARHYVANALIFICALAGLTYVYFPCWMRVQETAETAIEANVTR